MTAALGPQVELRPDLDWCKAEGHKPSQYEGWRPVEGLRLGTVFVCWPCLRRVVKDWRKGR